MQNKVKKINAELNFIAIFVFGGVENVVKRVLEIVFLPSKFLTRYTNRIQRHKIAVEISNDRFLE